MQPLGSRYNASTLSSIARVLFCALLPIRTPLAFPSLSVYAEEHHPPRARVAARPGSGAPETRLFSGNVSKGTFVIFLKRGIFNILPILEE